MRIRPPTWTARLALLVVVALGTLLVGTALAGAYQQRRDEPAYLAYARAYVGGNYTSARPLEPQQDRAWVAARPDLALAEGDRACAWLRTQPEPPSPDPSGRSTPFDVGVRYRQSNPPPDGLSADGQSTLVAGAWAHLCLGDRKAHTSARGIRD